MNVDIFERDLAAAVEPEHHHAGNPQREDVACGGEDGGGVEVGEELVFGCGGGAGVGPAHGGDGPECGGEPGVEDVGVLDETHRLKHVLILWIGFAKAYVKLVSISLEFSHSVIESHRARLFAGLDECEGRRGITNLFNNRRLGSLRNSRG